MTFREAIKTCLTEKYFKISGRATSAEYWEFQLFILLVVLGLGIIAAVTEWNFILILAAIFYALVIIPSFCAQIRRLHDAGFSGWFVLLPLIPYVGGIALLVMTLLKSDGDNKWGPNPQSTIE